MRARRRAAMVLALATAFGLALALWLRERNEDHSRPPADVASAAHDPTEPAPEKFGLRVKVERPPPFDLSGVPARPEDARDGDPVAVLHYGS